MNPLGPVFLIVLLSCTVFPTALFKLRFDRSDSSRIGFASAILGLISLPLLMIGLVGFVSESLSNDSAGVFASLLVFSTVAWIAATLGSLWSLSKLRS
ncbi:hypothetical protein [Wenzhouxiangella marina]|uniref:Uncharacterized protein n=1 Tax=Wenzhouxiangella marina TaxID=1579979 RepID=A0A0K0XTT0_9GAMM|nr:hypothetical protein [Wenzhouxiangella marina]AKS41088.1 hypothetical protein WM2015_707 [Wenzhouxiangella marina]MBB6087967.1 hypothetical protein [Wenzhouxiangella marina]